MLKIHLALLKQVDGTAVVLGSRKKEQKPPSRSTESAGGQETSGICGKGSKQHPTPTWFHAFTVGIFSLKCNTQPPRENRVEAQDAWAKWGEGRQPRCEPGSW